jgi:hypothetical protein
MKLTLKGLNAFAMATLAIPAGLIFASVAEHVKLNPFVAGGYLASLGLGGLCLFAAMGQFGEETRGSGEKGVGLMLLGLGFVAVPLAALLLAAA